MISSITPMVGPDFGAVGGSSQLRAIVGALLTYGLIVSVLMVIICAATWAIGSSNGSWQTASKGKTGLFVALGGAVLMGGARVGQLAARCGRHVVSEELLAFDIEGMLHEAAVKAAVEAAPDWTGAPLRFTTAYFPPADLDAAFEHWQLLHAQDKSHVNSRMRRRSIAVPESDRVTGHGLVLYTADLRCEPWKHAGKHGGCTCLGNLMYQTICESCEWNGITDTFLNTDDACGYRGIPKATLLTWRVRRPGYGPRAVKSGGRLTYRMSELDRWLRDHEESFAVDEDTEEVESASGGANQARTRNRVSRVRGGALRPAQP